MNRLSSSPMIADWGCGLGGYGLWAAFATALAIRRAYRACYPTLLPTPKEVHLTAGFHRLPGDQPIHRK